MTANHPHLITRKSDGFFWCGMFGFQQEPHDAQQWDSLRAAYAAAREINFREPVSVEPAEWYPARMLAL